MARKLTAFGVILGGGAIGLVIWLWFQGARLHTTRFIGADLIQNLSQEEITDLLTNQGEKIHAYTCVSLHTTCTFVINGEWPILVLPVFFPALFGLAAYGVFAALTKKKARPA